MDLGPNARTLEGFHARAQGKPQDARGSLGGSHQASRPYGTGQDAAPCKVLCHRTSIITLRNHPGFNSQENCAMKKFAFLTLILCAASLAATAAGIDGKWVSESKRGENTIQQTLTLKSDGGELTGTVETSFNRNNRPTHINDGKVDGT